jgi:hypothetical protein
MNFLCLGTAFLLIQLKLSGLALYVIKLIGFLLFIVGLRELSDLCARQKVGGEDKRISRLKEIEKSCTVSAVLCGVAVICMILLKALKPAEMAVNVIGILLGAAVTVMSLGLFRQTVNLILENEKDDSHPLVNNRANVVRLSESFTKTAVCTLAGLVCDIINRLIPVAAIEDVSGFLAYIIRITMYVFLIMTVVHFNRVRVDCNDRFEKEYKQ